MIITDQSVGTAVGETNGVPYSSVVRYRVEPREDAFVIMAILKNGDPIVVGWEGSMDKVIETLVAIADAEDLGETYWHTYDSSEQPI